jgi:hypothetical protein
VSHDRWTRWWQSAWSGPTRLDVVCRTLCGWERGVLRLDETVLAQSVATAIEHFAWVSSSPAPKPVDGLSLVLLGWTNGLLRIPRGVRLWPRGGPSQYALALEWLRDARNRRRCRPDSGLCDAW